MPYKDPENARANQRASYARHRQAVLAKHAAYRETHREERRANGRAYYAAHPDEKRAYAANNREHIRARKKAHHAAHREEAHRTQAAYRVAHLEEKRAYNAAYSQENRETLVEKGRAYLLAHPAMRPAIDARRRARKAAAPINDLSAPQWLEIQAAQDHRCAHCQKRCKGRLTQDHISPVGPEGSHTLHNIVGVCASCNSKKGRKPSPVLVQPLLLTVAPAKKR